MSTSVFYFGGYNASPSDIDKWLRGARQLRPDVDFIGFPWDSGPDSYPDTTVVKGAKKSGQFQAAVDAVQTCKADRVFIVGHSSGCAVANAVDKQVNDPRVELVALDGFSPDADQLKRATTQVWGAECDGVKSRNYPGYSNGRRHIHHAKKCKNKWALHFSVVNSNAVDGKVYDVASGYWNCEANLGFL